MRQVVTVLTVLAIVVVIVLLIFGPIRDDYMFMGGADNDKSYTEEDMTGSASLDVSNEVILSE